MPEPIPQVSGDRLAYPDREADTDPSRLPRSERPKPSPPDSVIPRATRTVAVWKVAIAGASLVSIGFGAHVALIIPQLKDMKQAQTDTAVSIRQDIGELRVDVRSVGTSISSDRERISSLETTVWSMPPDSLAAMRAAKKKAAGQ